jgi:hypothetical protein
MNTLRGRLAAALVCLLACTTGGVQADESYSGGVTIDIDREVLGYLYVADATVNLYENAWIKNVYNAGGQLISAGDVWADSGSVLNIYGGKIDNLMIITTSYNPALPEANVTVYGGDFAVNGVPVEPGTPELFLQNETLSGVYENGTPFAFNVECFWEGSFVLTVKLGWVASAPEISVEPAAVDFGQVEVGSTSQSSLVTIRNNGNAGLQLESLNIVQDENAGFGFIPLEQLPTTLEPNSVIDIEVVFAPATEGSVGAVLQIVSNDPVNPLVEIMLSGAGYIPALTPAEQIDAIIDFYLAGLEDNTIVGIGWGRTAFSKEIMLGQMLASSKNLIKSGYKKWALIPLSAINGHTDGKGRPADLVEGPGTALMNEMVVALIADIKEEGCGQSHFKNIYHKWMLWKWHKCRK